MAIPKTARLRPQYDSVGESTRTILASSHALESLSLRRRQDVGNKRSTVVLPISNSRRQVGNWFPEEEPFNPSSHKRTCRRKSQIIGLQRDCPRCVGNAPTKIAGCNHSYTSSTTTVVAVVAHTCGFLITTPVLWIDDDQFGVGIPPFAFDHRSNTLSPVMRRLAKQQPSSWEIDVALDAYTAPPPVGQFQHQPQVPASDNQSPQSNALVFCRGIDHVAVRGTTKHGGASFYNVFIFFKTPHSNIPIYRGQPTGEADVVLARRFSTFVNLRHEAYFHARTGHASSRACDFCSEMTQRLYDDPALPKLHSKLFFGEAAICEALENCISAILDLTNKLPIAPTGRQCDGQEEIPVLLQKFLTAAE